MFPWLDSYGLQALKDHQDNLWWIGGAKRQFWACFVYNPESDKFVLAPRFGKVAPLTPKSATVREGAKRP